MKGETNSITSLRHYIVGTLHDSAHHERSHRENQQPELDLASMISEFVESEELFDISGDHSGAIDSVLELLQECDESGRSVSFDRGREIPRHMGDLLRFWTGLFPEFVTRMRAPGTQDILLDPIQQGQSSYYVVSSFEEGAYASEAQVFGDLAEPFDRYAYGLTLMRASFEGFALQGWTDGFRA